MNAFERSEKSVLVERLAEAPQRLIVITGPRQTGKTTLVHQVLEAIERPKLYVPVDEPSGETSPLDEIMEFADVGSESTVRVAREKDVQWLVEVWERARRVAEASALGFVLVLDEIQKIPNWSESVKGLWDADRRSDRALHVVLLGSAPLLMQRGMSESLAGRYETIRLTHWSFAEMSEAFGFDLASYVYFGGYPGAAGFVNEQERWRDYILGSLVEPNIERDILAMERVDKPALLKRLFELSVSYSGQILSYNKMLGQLQDAGNTTTLARYLNLLSSAGLVAGLSKYAGGEHRRRGSSPKLLVLNTALMGASSGYTFEEAQADRSFWGRFVESAAGAHLFNTMGPGMRLHYWRDGTDEVDYVLQRGRRLVSFEVKSGRRKPSLRGLEAFAGQFEVEGSVVVGDKGVPLSEFLAKTASKWFEDQ